MPQLDSLRALAFFGVAASHWLPDGLPIATIGGTGVQLFFVLSGFLITGILLDFRRVQETTPGLTSASALRTFYARRSLRIFPLFYGVIAAAAVLNIGPIRDLWPWHVFYASNFLYGIYGSTPNDRFTHFWTLGVEEQFYFFWPFLVFFLRMETLKRVILGLIVLAPLFRMGAEYTFPEWNRVNYLPFSCGDSLALGAALAFASRNQSFFGWNAAQLAQRAGIVGLAGGLATGVLLLFNSQSFALETLGHTFLVLAYGWLVYGAARGFTGRFGDLLNRPELRFLGKISYGLYVFHHFFTGVNFGTYFERLGLPHEWAESLPVQLVCRLTVTIALAVVSWYLFEKPLSDLKRHFTLGKKLSALAMGGSRERSIESTPHKVQES